MLGRHLVLVYSWYYWAEQIEWVALNRVLSVTATIPHFEQPLLGYEVLGVQLAMMLQ